MKNSKNLEFASIKELHQLLDKKEISKQELLMFFLQRFSKYDSKIKSALEIFKIESIENNNNEGILSGIPGIIKDVLAQKDRKLTCGSKILENFVVNYDATAIMRLKEAGSFSIGRANCDEFAMGSSTETSAFFKTANPWNLNTVPGGSSGGSAAAVAAGLVPYALGSDTGGSVRQPAAFCGVVGLKPTYGAISRYGLVGYASSLDTVGIFTRTVADTAAVYSAIAGFDPKDSSCLKLEKKNYITNIEQIVPRDLKIGIVKNVLESAALNSEVKASLLQSIEIFKRQGYKLVEVELPALDYSAAVYFIISRAEAASNLARYDGVKYGVRAEAIENLNELYCKTRSRGFGREVQTRILIGNYVLSVGHAGAFYNNAKLVQQLIRKEFQDAFKAVDLLFLPAQTCVAFEFGKFDNNKLAMDLQDYIHVGINLAGIPSLVLQSDLSNSGMPVGFQLVGNHLSEELLFKVGNKFQAETDFHLKYPNLNF